jgi:hypothetical protein
MVKSALLLFAIAHVPLPDEGGLIAGFLEELREESQGFANRIVVVDDSMIVCV